LLTGDHTDMPRKPGEGKLPFDGQRPSYSSLTVEGVDSRFLERWNNYLKHYEAETGHKPDAGILFANIVSPALDTDKKFVQKESSGQFVSTPTSSNGAARGGAGGGGSKGGGASAGGSGAS
jgi:uncharacterized membrane protein YgcG